MHILNKTCRISTGTVRCGPVHLVPGRRIRVWRRTTFCDGNTVSSYVEIALEVPNGRKRLQAVTVRCRPEYFSPGRNSRFSRINTFFEISTGFNSSGSIFKTYGFFEQRCNVPAVIINYGRKHSVPGRILRGPRYNTFFDCNRF